MIKNNIITLVDQNKTYFTTKKSELDNATKELNSYTQNKLFHNPDPYMPYIEKTIDGIYENKNLRQSFFNSCKFFGANFNGAGLPGSIFIECNFKPCYFRDTNLQSCDFRKTTFNNIVFNYTRFNKSAFYKCKFKKCTFSSSSFNDAIFDSCQFEDCKFTITVENAIFKKTILKNVIIRNMNFEFATFDKIKLINTKFPFPTIPFIFNGITYFKETNDDVTITSAKNPNGMKKEEYLELLPVLEKFYLNSKNYFPLANILIANKDYEKALTSIIMGVQLSIDTRSFRMIKNYCKLLNYIKNITRHHKQELYNFILTKISDSRLDKYEQENLNLYIPEIKELLLNNPINNKIEFSFNTNISPEDIYKTNLVLDIFEPFFTDNKIPYTVELRHNSDFHFCFILDVIKDCAPIFIKLLMKFIDCIIDKKREKNRKLSNERKFSNKKQEKMYRKFNETMKKYTEDSIDKLKNKNIIIEKIIINDNGKVYIGNDNNDF